MNIYFPYKRIQLCSSFASHVFLCNDAFKMYIDANMNNRFDNTTKLTMYIVKTQKPSSKESLNHGWQLLQML